MSLINGNNFIFIHIYKCGGMTVRKVLSENLPVNEFHLSHSTAKEIMKYFYDSQGLFYFHTAFKFAFIRNPFDWVVSLFEFIRGNPEHENYEETRDMDFENFCQWNADAIKNKKKNINGTLNTLTEFLYDDDGNLLVDFVGRVENFDKDFEVVAKRLRFPFLGLPKVNQSERIADYREYYNDKSRKIVEIAFAEDLKRFDYEF